MRVDEFLVVYDVICLLTNAKLCFFEKQNKKLLSYFPTYLRPNDNMIISKYDDITSLEYTYL